MGKYRHRKKLPKGVKWVKEGEWAKVLGSPVGNDTSTNSNYYKREHVVEALKSALRGTAKTHGVPGEVLKLRFVTAKTSSRLKFSSRPLRGRIGTSTVFPSSPTSHYIDLRSTPIDPQHTRPSLAPAPRPSPAAIARFAAHGGPAHRRYSYGVVKSALR